MMRTAVFAAVLLAIPVAAEECRWQNAAGNWVGTNSPVELSVHSDGIETVCWLKGNGTGTTTKTAQCPDGDFAYFTISSSPGGEADILIFQNTAWYRWCVD